MSPRSSGDPYVVETIVRPVGLIGQNAVLQKKYRSHASTVLQSIVPAPCGPRGWDCLHYAVITVGPVPMRFFEGPVCRTAGWTDRAYINPWPLRWCIRGRCRMCPYSRMDMRGPMVCRHCRRRPPENDKGCLYGSPCMRMRLYRKERFNDFCGQKSPVLTGRTRKG